MTKLKRLATKEDEIVDVKIPISNEELKDRAKQYDLLTPKRFATRYNKMLFLPTSFKWNGSEYPIQYNYCINPFCCNFGKEQHKFKDVKGKPSRYKMTGSSKDKGHKGMYCNDNPIGRGVSQNCTVTPLSNWSVVEEIKRLIEINSIQDVEPDYQFHKEGCSEEESTPFNEPKQFYKRGKVGANLNAINVRRVRSSLMFYQKEKKPLLITNKRTPFFQCSLRWLLEGFQSVVLVIF